MIRRLGSYVHTPVVCEKLVHQKENRNAFRERLSVGFILAHSAQFSHRLLPRNVAAELGHLVKHVCFFRLVRGQSEAWYQPRNTFDCLIMIGFHISDFSYSIHQLSATARLRRILRTRRSHILRTVPQDAKISPLCCPRAPR